MFWIIQGQQRRKNKPEMSINGCGLCLRPVTYPMLVYSSLNLMSESYFCQCPWPIPWRKSPGSGEKEQFFSNFDLQRKSLPVYTFDEFHSETDVLSRVLFFRGYFLFEISRIKNSFHFFLFETKLTLSRFGQGQTAWRANIFVLPNSNLPRDLNLEHFENVPS